MKELAIIFVEVIVGGRIANLIVSVLQLVVKKLNADNLKSFEVQKYPCVVRFVGELQVEMQIQIEKERK